MGILELMRANANEFVKEIAAHTIENPPNVLDEKWNVLESHRRNRPAGRLLNCGTVKKKGALQKRYLRRALLLRVNTLWKREMWKILGLLGLRCPFLRHTGFQASVFRFSSWLGAPYNSGRCC